MQPRFALLAVVASLVPNLAHADDIGADPNDPGRVTRVRKGVWEFDLGALGVMSVDKQGDNSITRISTDASIAIHRFLRDNLSVGAAAIVNYDSSGGGNTAITVGGAGIATFHFRLGLGAFLRPQISLGALFGKREIPLDMTTVEEADQVAFIARIGLPIAYFTSKRFLLHAGPQLHITAGTYTPTGGESQTFTRISGGFGVGLGYVF
ncbi:MAG: hypothetical protein WKG01_24200 [Kofleriaceae bacterium]